MTETSSFQPPVPAAAAPPAPGAGLAIAALVLGSLAVFPLLGVPCGLIAIILGIISLARRARGTGMAVAGILLALLLGGAAQTATVVGLIRLAREAKQTAQRTVSQVNLMSLGRGVVMYAADNDGQPPPSLQHLIDQGMLVEGMLQSSDSEGGRPDLFYSCPTPLADISNPMATVIACSYEDIHPGGRTVLFADGHVTWESDSSFETIAADPQNAAFAAALKEAEGP
ncbi:hypothetical protein LCGC14_3023300 [marine sediment metagenome]|uniref:DUF4190 domain-containing protein n=1 Tax=marine sediment metagenome TaxID=412755 RepID=A0A0F8XHQ2_9ZZZZ